MKLILKRKQFAVEESELEADAVLVVDYNGKVECTKNRHGEIGVVCTHEDPHMLLSWVRELTRSSPLPADLLKEMEDPENEAA